jgi:drug/metabolite transporter (DMT)-like permease
MNTAPRPATGALLTGTLCYLFSSVVWGANVPLTAVLFRTFDPFFLSPLRVVIATVVLGGIVIAAFGWRALRVPVERNRLLVMSFALASFFFLYNLGLRYTNPITAAAIMAGSPVYAALTLRVFGRAPLEKGFWRAAALTLVGAGIAVYGRASDTGQSLHLEGGEPLLLIAYAGWTLYSIWAQRWFDPSVAQLRRTFVSTVGTVMWLTLAWAGLLAIGFVDAPTKAPDAEAVTYLLITAVLATALGGVTWNIGVNRIGLAAGSLWQNTVPVFAVLISMLFGLRPTPEQVLGGALVIGGVLYMQWRKQRG